MPRPKAALSWSSGKDSAWALHLLRQRGEVDVVALVTTVNQEFERVAMHAVRRSLLLAQAESAGLPLWEVPLPYPCSNAEYEERMRGLVARAREQGIECMAFGDLYLEDIRRYREERLEGTGIQPLFPLWKLPTRELAQQMLGAGVEAFITCVDPRQAPKTLAGRRWDLDAIAELPNGADPCGENGEFHTFVVNGPMLARPIAVVPGDVVEREGFLFADLAPASA